MKKVIKGILVVCCMILIFFFSSENGISSSKRSDGMILRIAEIIYQRPLSVKEEKKIVEVYSPIIRKGAHIGLYFILGFLWMSFWMEFGIPLKKQIFMSFFLVLIYASFDEFHQFFTEGRDGNLLDIGIDMIGGSLSFFCYALLERRKKYE